MTSPHARLPASTDPVGSDDPADIAPIDPGYLRQIDNGSPSLREPADKELSQTDPALGVGQAWGLSSARSQADRQLDADHRLTQPVDLLARLVNKAPSAKNKVAPRAGRLRDLL